MQSTPKNLNALKERKNGMYLPEGEKMYLPDKKTFVQERFSEQC